MPRKRRRHGWIKPLLNISCQFVAGDYPLTIKVCFENGVTRRYRDDELHQPAPGNYLKQPDGNYAVGYQFRDPGKKNRIRCYQQRTRQPR